MKGKLIKTEVNYLLEGEGGVVIASTSLKKEGMSLSIKNCEAIERGYDLVGIKRKVFGGFDGQPDSFTVAAVERTIQIMVELMGDKKFSEQDIHQALHLMNNRTRVSITGEALDIITKIEKQRDEIIQSLQPVEWDVEVEMVKEHIGSGCYKKYPKLDATGCLILKRI